MPILHMVLRSSIATVLLLCAASCGDDNPLPTNGPVAQKNTIRGHLGQGLLLVGTVEVLDGCLVVKRSGSEPVVPVFASGNTDWDGATLLWDGDEYGMGDGIELSGGSERNAGSQVDVKTYVPTKCKGFTPFYVDWYEGGRQYFGDGTPFPSV